MTEEDTVRCRKCRKVLLADLEGLQNAHGQKHQGGKAGTESTECTLLSEKSCLYISEDSYPQFITDALDMVDVRQAREALPSPISYPDRPVALTDADIKTFPLIGASKPVSTSECDSNASTPSPVLHQLCDEETPSIASDPDDMQLRESIPFPSDPHQNESPRKKIRRLARHRQMQKQITSTESDLQLIQSGSKSSNFCVLAPSDEETSDDDERSKWLEDIPPHLTCSVCLDLLYSPFVAQPCGHVFCEPCLRRLARPNPTKTCCPLCRQIIGQCMPSRDLAAEVREKFPNLYQERHEFEQTHNIQHIPLPWIKNFRMDQGDIYRGSLVQMAGGWRPVLLMLAVNALGFGSLALLKWYLESQPTEDSENLDGGKEIPETELGEDVL
ncbi:uncharacterized protein [Macrobrachium rosenbergii]